MAGINHDPLSVISCPSIAKRLNYRDVLKLLVKHMITFNAASWDALR
jgi:hypothetical protein